MVQIITFGCRLNTYESEVIKGLTADAALDSNTVIVNTCAVTAEAERQARQAIRKTKRENPNAKIIVTGCAAQINPQSFGDMPEVFQVLGNEDKLKKETYHAPSQKKIVVSDIMQVKEPILSHVTSFEGLARAFIQIQNGCDHRCTFCDIPYGRGNSRSTPMGHIVSEIQKLIDQDFQEVVLTGVDLTSYGHDLPGTPTLGQMVKRLLNHVPSLKRLRLSSLDPSEIDEDLYALIDHDERIMPHIHLSLQAGNDLILKRMKRRHLQADIYKCVDRLRRVRKNIILGADIIAGFPTETDEHFKDSLKVIKECHISLLHVFPYSPRPMTPAARMPQVSKKIIKERAALLRELGQKNFLKALQEQRGTNASVLIESSTLGRTENFLPVEINAEVPYKQGSVVQFHISSHTDKILQGNPL
jgi:threonylcarbamoyladenosine tRNA methylthiotransferase MtaB